MKRRLRGLRVPVALDDAIAVAAQKAEVSWSEVALAVLADAVRDGRLPVRRARDRVALDYLPRGPQSP